MKSLTDTWEEKIAGGHRLSYEEGVKVMENTPDDDLYELAHRLRKRFHGNKISTCSIMNARSGKCSEDCKWCSQSRFHNTDIEKYPLVGKYEALSEALHNANKGVHRFSLVTSGKTLTDKQMDQVCAIYRDMGAKTNIRFCASMGLLNKGQLQRLKECGVEHYHCNLETAPSHFPKLCTTHTIEDKLQTIRWAREAGMKVCSGGIIGMGETARQRIEFAVAVRNAGVFSLPLNVLNPIEGTPLQGTAPLDDREILVAFAMMRIMNPEAEIRFAGGRNLIKHLEEKILYGGANASIVGDMLTTSGSDIDTDFEMFRKCGFEI